jgi:hypothetical protein
VDLQDAEVAGLIQHVEPLGGGELLGVRGDLERIGAVGASQRAAVGELGDQADGGMRVRAGISGRGRDPGRRATVGHQASRGQIHEQIRDVFGGHTLVHLQE